MECHIAQAHIQALGEVTVIGMKTAMEEVVEEEMNMITEGGAVAEMVIVTGTMIHMGGIGIETGTVVMMGLVTGMDQRSVKSKGNDSYSSKGGDNSGSRGGDRYEKYESGASSDRDRDDDSYSSR
jgi:hypothetical protein